MRQKEKPTEGKNHTAGNQTNTTILPAAPISNKAHELCYSKGKPKGPVCRNAKSVEVAAPTVKRGFVMPEFRAGLSLQVSRMVYGCGGGYPQGRPHGYGRVTNHHTHPSCVVTRRVVPQSLVGALTMTPATLRLVRSHAPIQSPTDTTSPEIIAAYGLAENALSTALHALRADLSPEAIGRAIARATRAATALKRLATAIEQGGAA